MKRKTEIIIWILFLVTAVVMPVHAEGEPEGLYARSAVLMDADTGHILFGKNEKEELPMASTTKIMTLLVTLENADLEGEVKISSYAASQPRVHLGVQAGEHYRLKDLCYSLMLESHNDSAVAIAEYVGGSVEKFAELMNQKARDLGCFHTYFITPNGLDAQNEGGIHSTTAEELAKIMRFCIKNETFLEITRQQSWSFSDIEGTRSFTVNNKNAFLTMMAGALTGKTGFTGNAGYCYVGALERDGKRLIVALLACGWPNHKTWKWSDTQKLMNYGLSTFEKRQEGIGELDVDSLKVENGQQTEVKLNGNVKKMELLLKEEDEFQVKVELPDSITAPVFPGATVGSVKYYLNGRLINLFPIYVVEEAKEVNYLWYVQRLVKKMLNLTDCAIYFQKELEKGI